MTTVVLDASVVAKGFAPEVERNTDRAIALLDAVADARIDVVAPELLLLELVNVAARKWHLEAPALAVFATALRGMSIAQRDVDLDRVAAWSAAGLTAYDAAYVAVAEAEGVPLVTDDDALVDLAPGIAVSLATFVLDADDKS